MDKVKLSSKRVKWVANCLKVNGLDKMFLLKWQLRLILPKNFKKSWVSRPITEILGWNQNDFLGKLLGRDRKILRQFDIKSALIIRWCGKGSLIERWGNSWNWLSRFGDSWRLDTIFVLNLLSQCLSHRLLRKENNRYFSTGAWCPIAKNRRTSITSFSCWLDALLNCLSRITLLLKRSWFDIFETFQTLFTTTTLRLRITVTIQPFAFRSKYYSIVGFCF